MTITGGTTAAGPSGMTTLTLKDGTKTVVSIDLVGNFIGDTFTVTPIGGAKTVAVTSGRRPDDGHGGRVREPRRRRSTDCPAASTFPTPPPTSTRASRNLEADEVPYRLDRFDDRDPSISALRISRPTRLCSTRSSADSRSRERRPASRPISTRSRRTSAMSTMVDVSVGHRRRVARHDRGGSTRARQIQRFRGRRQRRLGQRGHRDSRSAGGRAARPLTRSASPIPARPSSTCRRTKSPTDAALLAKIVGAYDLDVTGVFGEPYDAYNKQFNAAHQLIGETFFVPGPASTLGKIALPTAPSQIRACRRDVSRVGGQRLRVGRHGRFPERGLRRGRHRDLHRKRRQERRHGGGRRCERRGSGAIRPSRLLQRREFLDVGRIRTATCSSHGRRPRATLSRLPWRSRLPAWCRRTRRATFTWTGSTSAYRCQPALSSPISAIAPAER